MSNTRKTSVIIGIIFIVATLAALIASSVDPILADKDYLSKTATESTKILIGVFFYIVAALTSVSIAIAFFPILKNKNVAFALGAVIFRTIEAVFYLVAVVCLLSLVTLSRAAVNADAGQVSVNIVVGSVLLKAREHATLLGVVSFCIGALLYYLVFFKSRLIPLWLSLWGIVAVLLMLAACALSMFSDNPITGYTPLVLPIAVQEMVFAVWLIVKGFRDPKK